MPRPFLIFLLLLYAVTLLFFLNRGTPYTADSIEYMDAANNLLEYGHWYAGNENQLYDVEQIDFRLFSKRPPGYPVFLLLIGQWYAVLLAQIIASFMGIWLGFRLIFRDSPSKQDVRFWWIAAFVLLLSPAQFYYLGFIMSDLLLQNFVLFTLFFYSKWRLLKASKWLWASSLSLSVALLLKPVMLPLVMVLALLSLVMAARKHVAYLIYLLPLFFWTGVSLKNQHYTGQFEYSSIGVINTVQYNGRMVLSRSLGSDSAESVLEPLMYVPHNKDEYAEWKKKCTDFGLSMFRDYPLQTVKLHMLGSLRMPFDPGRFEWALLFNDPAPEEGGLFESFNKGGWKRMWDNIITQKIGILLLALIPVYGLRWLLFLIFFWMNRKDQLTTICAALVFYFILIAGPIGASRFLLPVLPLIIWGAASALYRLTITKAGSVTSAKPREAKS